MSDSIEIRVRSRGDTHLARTGRGKSAISASSISDALRAAYACAAKALGCHCSHIAVQRGFQRGEDGEPLFRARRLVPGERIATITFVDQGQDFLEWEVTADGTVIECRPFQAWLWCGATVLHMSTIELQPYAVVIMARGEKLTIKHLIERVTFSQWQPEKGASS